MSTLREPLFGATKVLAVSDRFAEFYRSSGVPNVMAIPNGISDLPEPKRTASADGRVRLGFIGGMDPVKGYHLIKYAFIGIEFRHLSLTVIDGSLTPGQSKPATWNGTPVEFLAKVPEHRVDELYGGIDVLLAPSIWPESFGLVTREALHFGCWVVASNRGSIGASVIEGVNGFLIDVADASDLIRVLTEIDGNPSRYLNSPPASPPTRKASQQSDDLAALYKSVMSETIVPPRRETRLRGAAEAVRAG
jgi:glycosyltransferase involved in cell wall biosynthesis